MDIASLLGDEASSLLDHKATAFPKELLTLPGPDYVSDVFALSDRSPTVLRNLGTLHNHGRLRGTGYVSILPVDQGIEHSAAASFSPNPEYFDPARLCDLAIEGGCNAIASTLGTLGSVSRRYVHRIPFIVKINHNDLLRYPNSYDERLFASAQLASDLGAVGIGATIYFGSEGSIRQIEEIGKAFAEAHRWPGTHSWSKGVPATDQRRRGAHQRRAGRVPGRIHHGGLIRCSDESRRSRGRGVADVAESDFRIASGAPSALLLAVVRDQSSGRCRVALSDARSD